jgi:aminoglycoside phosphotransferase (APT) family kinase protein
VPVPKVLGTCFDDEVIGNWFYVMELVEGRIFWDASFSSVDPKHRPAMFNALNKTIADLHSVVPSEVGLADFGRPSGYVARQTNRLSEQYLTDVAGGRDPHMDRLVEWLKDAVPTDDNASAIVHGDYRCDNMVFHSSEPFLVAILDWELATIGHPIADFAYHSMMYRMPPHIVAGLAGADLNGLNLPTEETYVERYAERMGLAVLPNYQFYMAFAFFRVSAIFHGIRSRVARRTAASAQAAERVKVFPELAELAWQQAKLAGA